MIYVLYGDDAFSCQEALDELYQAVGPPEVTASNVTQMEATGFDMARFAAATQTVPFLAERRLVVVRGLLATAEEREPSRRGGRRPGRSRDLGVAEGLVEAVQGLPPTTDVALVEGRLSPNNPLLRQLTPLAQVRQFPTLRSDALVQWVRERIARKGGTITGNALRLLVELVGGNLWNMDSELEKLTIYCQGRAVEAEDVQVLVSSAREANIFAAVDALMEGRADTAMEHLSRLLRGGATAAYLLAMIARQARLLVLAQALAAQRVPHPQQAERLGIQQEFVLRKTLEQARRHTPSQLRQLYHLLLETDLAIKGSDITDEMAMAELVAKTGAVGRRVPVRPHGG